MQDYSETRFKAQVDKALVRIKTVLTNAREPQYAADVNHSYDDKYLLAQFLTNVGLAAHLNCLEALGLNTKTLQQLKAWSRDRSVTIRLQSEERCSFDRETTRKVESATQYVTEYQSSSGAKSSVTDKVVTTITEYFWKFQVEYSIVAFPGNAPEDKIVLQSRKGGVEVMTTTKTTPRPSVVVVPNVDVNVTWLLSNLNEACQLNFVIDRTAKACHTPRRNPQIDSALSHFRSFRDWSQKVHSYFTHQLFPVQSNHGLDLSAINDAAVFVPVVPLFEEPAKHEPSIAPTSTALITVTPDTPAKSAVLPKGDVNDFLAEEKRSLAEKFEQLAKVLPESGGKLITCVEANILVTVLHASQVSQYYADGVDYIEEMLHKQLIQAIGKELTPVDFTNYMRFHNRKLFRGEFEPIPFCHAVRRPDHYPEGTLSIEAILDDGSMAEPIFTTVRRVEPVHPMRFPINAATNITFTGERYLHGWVSHEFSGDSGLNLQLVARARQFSSFILLVGRIASSQVFEPKYGIIIQNKDDLKIPLLLETIPTPKEFRDAIESMSPEQQRFCKAYRAMQLESTLFAVCVIQIKPQLEKLLKLPEDSMTKEIRLTQDLLELFIKYQIPSDLLSYDGPDTASNHEKVQVVKGYVATMQDMIKEARQRELDEQKQKYEYERLQQAPKIIPQAETVLKMASASTKPKTTIKFFSHKSSAAIGGSAVPRSPSASASAPPPPSPSPAPSPAPAPAPAPAPSPSPSPAPSPSTPTTQEPAKTPSTEATTSDENAVGVFDYTQIPSQLDQSFQVYDEDSCLHSTIINPGNTWTKRSQKSLLAEPVTNTLNTTEQAQEKNSAFDLLDALSRSGGLSIDHATLHVVLAATHCFDKSLVNTVIQDNVNPIEKVERSVLIVSSVIQGRPAAELVKGDQLERVGTYSPLLIKGKEHSENAVVVK